MESTKTEELEVALLLEAIYHLTSYDFREYNRSSITRRVHNRLALEHLPNISRLTEKVIYDAKSRNDLLNDFSINVTEMFRDPSFFKALRDDILPRFKNHEEIRIWHAGCATGEEVFSVAILLTELGLIDKATLYATDMNEDVLERARAARFPIQKMQTYTKNYMLAGGSQAFSEYYYTDSQFAYIQPKLLEPISFAQHNLVTDQSFNEFHLIICRNVLIYFSPTLQNKVYQLFHESLIRGGFLCLGAKESLRFSGIMPKFEETIANEKIYQKIYD